MCFQRWVVGDFLECRSLLLHFGQQAVRLQKITPGDNCRPVFYLSGKILFQKTDSGFGLERSVR
jgi:hypothetical protein